MNFTNVSDFRLFLIVYKYIFEGNNKFNCL